MQKVSIYQLLPRLFSNTKRKVRLNGTRKNNGCGKLNEITKEALQAIKELGITHIWYTGVLEHACVEGYPKLNIPNDNPRIIKGMAGSPYAIKDYYDIAPDLAVKPKKRIQEFRNLVARTHEQGLKVIIDFVPNHVARNYSSDIKPETNFGENDNSALHFSTKNDFYYLDDPLELPEESGTQTWQERLVYKENPAKATGNDHFSPHVNITDWYETVKLNYGTDYTGDGATHCDPIPSLWHKMRDILKYWVLMDVDGFRCDMVEMTPLAFWQWVIPQIKSLDPELIFVAEVYNPEKYESYINEGGFDYIYDKVGLYDDLRDIYQNGVSATILTKNWQKLGNLQSKMLRFMENHDEQRVASKYFFGDGFSALPSMLVTATMHTGPVMLYSGQEVGEPAEGESGYSGDDGRTTIFDYWVVPELQKWVNNGYFNGGKLSSWQKDLRQRYIEIMELAQRPAVVEGAFYDLMYANQDSEGLDVNCIYAYIRHIKSERLLFVVNFNTTEQQRFKLRIPVHCFEIMGIKSSYNLFCKEITKTELTYLKYKTEEVINNGLGLNIPPLSYKTYSLEIGL